MAGSEGEQIPEDLAAFERLVIEAVIDESAAISALACC